MSRLTSSSHSLAYVQALLLSSSKVFATSQARHPLPVHPSASSRTSRGSISLPSSSPPFGEQVLSLSSRYGLGRHTTPNWPLSIIESDYLESIDLAIDFETLEIDDLIQAIVPEAFLGSVWADLRGFEGSEHSDWFTCLVTLH